MATKTFKVSAPNGLTRAFDIKIEDEQSFQNLMSLLQIVEEYSSKETDIIKNYSFGSENHNKNEIVAINIKFKN